MIQDEEMVQRGATNVGNDKGGFLNVGLLRHSGISLASSAQEKFSRHGAINARPERMD